MHSAPLRDAAYKGLDIGWEKERDTEISEHLNR